MAQVAASGAWAGAPDDPFSDLSEAERRGSIAFGFSGKRLQRDRMICGAVALVAVALMLASTAQMVAPAVSILGAVVLAIALVCFVFFSRRLSRAGESAPLRFSANAIHAGETGRTLDFASIEDVRTMTPGVHNTRDALLLVLVVTLGSGTFLIRRSNMQTIRLVGSNEANLLELDLNVLEGDPARIARIIDARIALARRKA